MPAIPMYIVVSALVAIVASVGTTLLTSSIFSGLGVLLVLVVAIWCGAGVIRELIKNKK